MNAERDVHAPICIHHSGLFVLRVAMGDPLQRKRREFSSNRGIDFQRNIRMYLPTSLLIGFSNNCYLQTDLTLILLNFIIAQYLLVTLDHP